MLLLIMKISTDCTDDRDLFGYAHLSLTLTFALKLTPFSLQVKPLFVSLRA